MNIITPAALGLEGIIPAGSSGVVATATWEEL
jgi:hypothetical protein